MRKRAVEPSHPFILGGIAHSRLLAAEGVLAMMRNAHGVALFDGSTEERLGAIMAVEFLVKDARKAVLKLNTQPPEPHAEEDAEP